MSLKEEMRTLTAKQLRDKEREKKRIARAKKKARQEKKEQERKAREEKDALERRINDEKLEEKRREVEEIKKSLNILSSGYENRENRYWIDRTGEINAYDQSRLMFDDKTDIKFTDKDISDMAARIVDEDRKSKSSLKGLSPLEIKATKAPKAYSVSPSTTNDDKSYGWVGWLCGIGAAAIVLGMICLANIDLPQKAKFARLRKLSVSTADNRDKGPPKGMSMKKYRSIMDAQEAARRYVPKGGSKTYRAPVPKKSTYTYIKKFYDRPGTIIPNGQVPKSIRLSKNSKVKLIELNRTPEREIVVRDQIRGNVSKYTFYSIFNNKYLQVLKWDPSKNENATMSGYDLLGPNKWGNQIIFTWFKTRSNIYGAQGSRHRLPAGKRKYRQDRY